MIRADVTVEGFRMNFDGTTVERRALRRSGGVPRLCRDVLPLGGHVRPRPQSA